jgi:hypothetical protein
LKLEAAWGDPMGAPVLVRAAATQAIALQDASAFATAQALGDAVAAQLRAQGAA